jgi:GNAT superfamily N-acetyltransferase
MAAGPPGVRARKAHTHMFKRDKADYSVSMLKDPDLLAAADANRAEFTREHARWLPPTALEEHTDLLLCAAGTQFPAGPWNSLLPLGRAPAAPDVLRVGEQFFFGLRRGFTIYTRGHLDSELCRAAAQAGYASAGEAPGMALTERILVPALPHGVSVRQVESESDAQTFIDIQADAYETMRLPASVTRKLLGQPQRWLSSYCTAHVLYANERALAGGMLLYSHGIAGVYWVGTRPEARGHGYAEALTRAISECAFAHGARAVILQASAQGEPVYRRIGFREFTRYPWFLATFPRD